MIGEYRTPTVTVRCRVWQDVQECVLGIVCALVLSDRRWIMSIWLQRQCTNQS
jgi:hypothetical protein